MNKVKLSMLFVLVVIQAVLSLDRRVYFNPILIQEGESAYHYRSEKMYAINKLYDKYLKDRSDINKSDESFEQRKESRLKAKNECYKQEEYLSCIYDCFINESNGKQSSCVCTYSGSLPENPIKVQIVDSEGNKKDIKDYVKTDYVKPQGFGTTYVDNYARDAHQVLGTYLGVTGGLYLLGSIAGIIVTGVLAGKRDDWGTGHTIGMIGSGVGVIFSGWRIGVGRKIYWYKGK